MHVAQSRLKLAIELGIKGALQINVSLTIIESRVDWISCSAKQDNKASVLSMIASRELQAEKDAGDRPSRWGRANFKGESCGHWKVASGPDGVIVEVGGLDAHQWAGTLAAYAEHFSRVDYCVTCLHDKGTRRPSDAIWRHFRERDKAGDKVVNMKQVREIQGGNGVSAGARSGAIHIRVYDKHAESKGLYPEGAWRYEVEFKRHQSEAEHAQIRADLARTVDATSIVATAMQRWGMAPPWGVDNLVDLAKAPERVRDAERSLEWLREQVAPTVAWLMAIGYGREVWESLNLPVINLEGVA